MTSLREFARWAGIPILLPGFKLPTPAPTIPHPLPGLKSDIEALLNNCIKPRQYGLIALLGYQGLRLCEALAVQPKHFDVREMTLQVWGKGDKKRILPITTNAEPHLFPVLIDAQLNNSQSVIGYSDRGARHFISSLGVRAQLSRPISSHDLRMTFATCAFADTKDIRVVQEWLGHSDVTTTQGYLAGNIETMRAAGEF
jgi:integrase/recombinase XerD